MFFQMLGILILTVAAFAAAFRAHLGSRKPDFPKPGLSSVMTMSGMVFVGLGLLLYGHPSSRIIVTVGAWDYAIGAIIAFYKIRQKRMSKSA